MCGSAGLNADEAGRKVSKVIEYLRPAKAHLGDPAALGICGVNLENLLGDIEANDADLHRMLLLEVDQHYGHYDTPMLGAGAVHLIKGQVPGGMPEPALVHEPRRHRPEMRGLATRLQRGATP